MLTKSTQNSALVFLASAVFAVVCLASFSPLAQDNGSDATPGVQQDRSPMLNYYWKAAGKTFARQDPGSAGVSYTLTTRTWVHHVSSSGEITRTDTVIADFEFKGKDVVSHSVGEGNPDLMSRIDLSYPDVFSGAYYVNFFPNDTGGPELALGLVADSAFPELPDGLIIVDRQEKTLRRMYLYYPNRDGYKRFSRCFRFVERGGFVFPDSVWEVGVKLGFLSNENYRIETAVTDVLIDVAARREPSRE